MKHIINKNIVCSLLFIACAQTTLCQNDWWHTLKQWNPTTNLYAWAQRNKSQARVLGSLATAALLAACYYGIKSYCQNSAAHRPAEENPVTVLSNVPTGLPSASIRSTSTLDHTKEPQETTDEVWGNLKTKEFYTTQEELTKKILVLEKCQALPHLHAFNYMLSPQTSNNRLKKNLPSIKFAFDVYTLLKQKNLIDDYQIKYSPLEQNMFYLRNSENHTYSAYEFTNIQLNHQKKGTQVSQAEKDMFTHNYKIHLMPKKDEFVPVILTIAELLKNDNDLLKLIKVAKFDPSYILEYADSKPNDKIIPAIILYTFADAAQTQKALDILFNTFKNTHFQGNGIRPRFNAKVTDLIYVAQGNGDDKVQENVRNTNLFEMPDMIYYDNRAFDEAEKSYHLTYPNTNIEITKPTSSTSLM